MNEQPPPTESTPPEEISSRPAPSEHGLEAGGDARDRSMVASVGRALLLLDTFGGMGNTVGVSELARRSGLHKTTAYRLLNQLVESGYIMRVGDGYKLSLHTFSLGSRFVHDRSRGLREIAAPHLGDLFLQTGWIVTLATLDGSEIVFLEKLQSTKSPPTPTVAGGRFPATVTALGKALLAFSDPRVVQPVLDAELPRRTPHSITTRAAFIEELNRVRSTGVAFEDEEAVPGITSVAAPMLIDGGARAAVSLSGPAGDSFDPRAFVEQVQATARSIAVALAWERKHSR